MLALGLLVILLRARDNDDVTVASIAKNRKEGRDALTKAMRNLVDNGYVVKFKIHGTDGKWRTEFVVDTTPLTREFVAEELTAIHEEARGVRVEPGWLDPRERPRGSTPRTTRGSAKAPQLDRQGPSPDGSQAAGETSAPLAQSPPGTDQPADVSAAVPWTAGQPGLPEPFEAGPVSEGAALLAELAERHPGYALTGQVFRDQTRMIDGLLASGYPHDAIRNALWGRQLPASADVRRSPGAVISWRLSQLGQTPPPSQLPTLPPQGRGPDDHQHLGSGAPQPPDFDDLGLGLPAQQEPTVVRERVAVLRAVAKRAQRQAP